MKLLVIVLFAFSQAFAQSPYSKTHRFDSQSNSFQQMKEKNNQTAASTMTPREFGTVICEFDAGTCNGARIDVFEDEKVISTGTITSEGKYQTPTLRKYKKYKVILTWQRYNFSESRAIERGESVMIFLNKPQ
jgi:hypothetical protein